nr:hypothetical protein [Tanacetum cinerariifolium]
FFQQLANFDTKDYQRDTGSSPVSGTENSGSSPIIDSPENALTWQQADAAAAQFLGRFFATDSQPFNEFSAMRQALAMLPDGTALHLANSMAVRYANIL